MSHPNLVVTPLRPAVRSDAPTTLDVLLTITPPPADPSATRPPLNLALVLDRSGSMGEARKITFARQAAAFAVRELLPTDRVSVVLFDDKIETLVPNTAATNKDAIAGKIEAVEPRGSTALHGGWQEGGRQAQTHPLPAGVNRVLLLSDGLANVGESRPDKISTDVHALAKAGVSTTTLGVGADYNEDLLEAMARSGDGNYYYVESPAQLPNIFRTELNGLSATRGVDVLLTPTPAAGVTLAEVLTECDKTVAGELRLPNLVSGVPVRVVVRLTVDAFNGEKQLLTFKLAWHAPKDDTHHTTEVRLALPAVPSSVFDGLADNAEVREQITLLELAKQKKAAAEAAAKGDIGTARKYRMMSASLVADSPMTELMRAEALDQDQIDEALQNEDLEVLSKRAKNQAYRRNTSKE